MGLICLCAVGTAGFGSAADGRPRLSITDPAPLTVRGVGFLSHEAVSVTATMRIRRSRSAVADARGRWSVRFRGVSVLDTCASYLIKALGEFGSRATLKVTVTCS